MRVFARALLQFWFQSEHIVLINSPLDPVADTAWAIPPKLIPLFGPDQGVNEHSYWAALAELDKELTLSELFEQDVRELLHLVEVYALCHEFAHILERHFDLLENPSVLDFAATSHLTRTQLRRGLELHADVVASAFSPTILVEQIRQAYGRWSAMAARRRGFLRLSYGVTMLYAIFDAHRKYLLSYDQDAYTHPIIRRELFKDASTNTIRMNEGFVTRFFWTAAEVEGWVRCVHALADLDVRSLLGDYGELDHKNGTLRGTIHSLNYGASIAFSEAIASMIQEAYSLVRKVEGLLTAFCRPDSSKNTTQSSFRRDLIGDLTWTDLLPETGDPDLEDSDEHSRLALKLMMRFRAALWG